MSGTAPVLMLFDGACVFCSRSMQFVLKRTDDRLRFCAMQSPSGQDLLRHLDMPLYDFKTLAVIDGGEALFRSDAVIRLGELMAPPWPIAAKATRYIPRRLRDKAYDLIARHRFQLMGRQSICAIARDVRIIG